MTKLFLLIGLVGLLLLPAAAIGQVDNCVTCHAEIEDDDGPAAKFVKDIHSQKGLGCADCHGGDPSLDDMDDVRESGNFRGVPEFYEVPEFCARCHADAAYMRNHNPGLPTDQLEKYKTSTHGQKLFGQRDHKVATCISCHTVHEIGDGKLPHSSTHPLNVPETCGRCHADAELMAEYGIPTDQLDDFKQSAHGLALLEHNDLGAPACNDCHSNHGAAPPGVHSLAAVCGNCHAFEAELFAASPHQQAYQENDFPMCETCHSNHKVDKPYDAMVGSTEPAVCVECHAVDDGTRALQVADSMVVAIGSLKRKYEEAEAAMQEAVVRGMMTIDEEFMLKEVSQSLIQTRTLVHSFDSQELSAKAQSGIAKADSVIAASAELVQEHSYRRKGLTWATLFITILAIGLYIKIRRLG